MGVKNQKELVPLPKTATTPVGSGASPTEKLAALANKANAAHAQATEAFYAGCRNALPFAIECGEVLNEAKGICKAAGIKWGPWRDKNFKAKGSERTAQVYMQLARDKKLVLKKAQTSAVFSIEGALEWVREKKGTGQAKPTAKPTHTSPANKVLEYMKRHGVTITYDEGGDSVDLIGNDPHDRATMIVLTKAKPADEKYVKPTDQKPKPSSAPTTAEGATTDDGGGRRENGTPYKVFWRRVTSGQATVIATDQDDAARKVRTMAEQRSSLDVRSDARPDVEVTQVEDATGKVLAVSRSGDLGQPTEAASSPTQSSMPERIKHAVVVMVEVNGKLGYKTEKHDGNRWILFATDEHAAKLAVDGCVPKPANEHGNAIANNKASTAGACFVSVKGDGTLAREFVPWEEV